MQSDQVVDAEDQQAHRVELGTGVAVITAPPFLIRCCDRTPAVGSRSGRPRYEQLQKDEFFQKTQRMHQNVHEIDRRAEDPDAWTISHTAVDCETREVVHHSVEPLRKHTRHGSAKRSRPARNP